MESAYNDSSLYELEDMKKNIHDGSDPQAVLEYNSY
jgi:hypothetical protein